MKKLLLLLILSFPLFTNAQNTVIKGVVTYYFNQNYGDKPDIGSEVTLVKEKDIEVLIKEYKSCKTKEVIEEKYRLEDEYKIAKSNLNSLPWNAKSKTEKFHRAKVDSVNFLIKENQSKKVKSEVCEMLVLINYKKNNKDGFFTTVDGSGNYSMKIPSGNYLIAIRSNGRKYTILKNLEMIEGRENEFSYNFEDLNYTGLIFTQ